MTETKSVKTLKKQLGASIAMVLVAAVALGSSTYAWFVNNTMVKTTGADVSASAAYALLISEGADGSATGWVTTHTMTNDKNLAMVPVSTTGKTTTTPMTFWKSNEWATVGDDGAKQSLVNTYSTTTANTEYLTETFQIKASQACNLYLDQDTVINATGADKTTSTLDKTLRVALVVTDKNGYNKTFFYQVDGEKGNGTANTTNGTADGVARAVKDGSKSGVEALDVISTDNMSADNKVPVLTTVNATSSALVEKTAATTAKVDTLYAFANPEDVCTVTAYIWMEGCDEDCTAANITTLTGEANKINAVFGFCAGATN